MNTYRVTGLDLGTELGLTSIRVRRGAKFIPADIVHSDAYSLDSALSLYGEVGRWIKLVQILNEYAGTSDYVIYEYVPGMVHTGGNASHIYGGLEATLQLWAHQNNRALSKVSIQHTKRALTMDSGATKPKMVQYAMALLGLRPTEDQADSLGVTLAGIQLIKKA